MFHGIIYTKVARTPYSFSFEQNLLDLDEIMQSIVQNEN